MVMCADVVVLCCNILSSMSIATFTGIHWTPNVLDCSIYNKPIPQSLLSYLWPDSDSKLPGHLVVHFKEQNQSESSTLQASAPEFLNFPKVVTLD